MRSLIVGVLLLALAKAVSIAQPSAAPLNESCGEVMTIQTHDRTTTGYALARGQDAPAQDARITLVLVVGGGGAVNLDDKGCPRSLSGNVLMRMRPLFHSAGFGTALLDAPSDHSSGDGLAGFRIAPQHAEDLGKIVSDVRKRTNGSVWLLGHSRGTISAANAAARLSDPAAPDGLVLLSAMMSGDARARKYFVAQTVFDVPLQAIKMPVLVIGQAADNCLRSPPNLMANIAERAKSARKQVATVTGGPIQPGRTPSLATCEVREPHDFVDQEAEVAAGILRLVRGGSY